VFVFFFALITSGEAWSQAAPAAVKQVAAQAAGAAADAAATVAEKAASAADAVVEKAAEVNAAADKAAAKPGEKEGNKLDTGVSLDPLSWWTGVKRLVALGGALVIVQLTVSVLGLAIVMFKGMQFLGVRDGQLRALHKAIDTWEGGDVKKGQEMIKRNGLGFAKDVEYALKRLRPDNVELVREELYRRARVFLQPLHDHLPTIEIIYYIAPLLGLLGTVTGIIASFQALEASGAANDAAKLAGGIWEALLCTGVGLSMAIPFAVLHSLLETRLNHIVAGVEDVIARVFTTELDVGQADTSPRA
jgi:biopolymer transport protein ExbB